MPETRGTDSRLTQLETTTENTSAQVQALTTAIQHLTKEVTTINGNFQTLTAEMEQLRRNPNPHLANPNPYPNPNPNPNPNQPIDPNPVNENPIPFALLKPLRIVVPRFEEGDPVNWIFQIQQFFDLHQTPVEHRLRVASFYFDGAALSWFQWVKRNTQINDWATFLVALQERFGPPENEDFQGQLAKLRQTTTVIDYYNSFELLSNRVNGLPESFLLSCFISGLKPEIQVEVASFAPTSISRALALAKVQENKQCQFRAQPKLHSPYPPLLPTPVNTIPVSQRPPLIQGSKFPVKRLTQSEMAVRREKGLCYNCDEKFVPGHICKAKFMYLVVPDEELELNNSETSHTGLDYSSLELRPPHISYHALMGMSVPRTLKLCGSINGNSLLILVDGGSTNNFIPPSMVTRLQLQISKTPDFKVMVGSGEYLHCKGLCKAVHIIIQGITFIVDFFVLPVEGVALVLGVQWLQQLGPVLFDYNKLTLGFFLSDDYITLKGHASQQYLNNQNLTINKPPHISTLHLSSAF